MYRYVKSTSLLYMFDDFDLEDFSDIVTSRVARRLHLDDLKAVRVKIDANRYGEFLNLDVTTNGKKYSISYPLDSRKIHQPRDLAIKYSEPVMYELIDEIQSDEVQDSIKYTN